ncbi:unnamed protein product, partial [Closterium sp. NIES-64]
VDAIMLGAETLRGLYPTETVSTVRLICSEAEKAYNQELYYNHAVKEANLPVLLPTQPRTLFLPAPPCPCQAEKAYNQELYFKKAVKEATDTMSELEAMASSAVKTAEKVHAAAIVVFTSSGRMARQIVASGVGKLCLLLPNHELSIPVLNAVHASVTHSGPFTSNHFFTLSLSPTLAVKYNAIYVCVVTHSGPSTPLPSLSLSSLSLPSSPVHHPFSPSPLSPSILPLLSLPSPSQARGQVQATLPLLPFPSPLSLLSPRSPLLPRLVAKLVAKYKPTMPVLTLVIPRLYVDKLRWTVQGEVPAHMCCLMRGLIPMMATPKTLNAGPLLPSLVPSPTPLFPFPTLLFPSPPILFPSPPILFPSPPILFPFPPISFPLHPFSFPLHPFSSPSKPTADVVDNTGPLLGRVGQLQQQLHHQLLPSSQASTHPLPSNPHGPNQAAVRSERSDQVPLSEGSNERIDPADWEDQALGRLAAGGLGGGGGGRRRGREEERSAAGMVDHGGIVPEGVVPDALDRRIPMLIRMSPERLQLPLEALPHAIDSSEQKIVMLAYRERFDKFGDLIRCHGPPCPDFAPCGSAYPKVHACWNEHLDAPLLLPARAPLNCPKKAPLKNPRVPWQNHDKTCSHPRDFNPREPSAMQVFRLHEVMVTHKGFVFNATHRYVHQGCKRFNPFSYPQGQKVHRMKLAFDWGYTQGSNFYHFLVEAIPSFFVAAAALPNLRDIPIIAERFQWDLYDSIGRIFIGVNRTDMRALQATEGDLFHVDTLYLPMLQECGAPNKALWMELRRHHLLHRQGLPLFRPDFSYHYRPALSYQQLTHLPPDWVVVLAQRPSGKRSFSNAEEVKEAVLAAFPAERVVVFDGSLQLMQ